MLCLLPHINSQHPVLVQPIWNLACHHWKPNWSQSDSLPRVIATLLSFKGTWSHYNSLSGVKLTPLHLVKGVIAPWLLCNLLAGVGLPPLPVCTHKCTLPGPYVHNEARSKHACKLLVYNVHFAVIERVAIFSVFPGEFSARGRVFHKFAVINHHRL